MRDHIEELPRKPAHGAMLLSVQVMRGVAALSVVAFHVSLIMAKAEYGGLHAYEHITSRGWMGVNFFFVLSGFIILLAHADDIGRPDRLGRYVWRRFSRIYPAYWVFLTLFILASLAGLGRIDSRLAWVDLLSAYTLIRWVDQPALPLKVAWTLLFEVVFYGVFALALLNRAVGIVMMTCWLAAILMSSFVWHSLAMDWASMWNINFFFGMLACVAYKRLPPRYGPGLGVIGLVLLAVLVAQPAYDSIETQQATPLWLMMLGIPFALILLGFALTERHYKFVPSRPLVALGEASYAIYLVHSAAISLMSMMFHRLDLGRDAPNILFFVLFIGSVSAGVLAHLLVEKPLLRVTRRLASIKAKKSWRERISAAP